MADSRKHVLVLGAGVIGLSTALRLQDKYNVTVVADVLPGDERKGQAQYANAWAGAQHVSFATLEDTRQQRLDRATFDVMWDMSSPGCDTAGLFMRLTQKEYYRSVPSDLAQGKSALDFMPDFRCLRENELVPGSKAGLEFTTVTINVPAYLQWLMQRFLSRGGKPVRARIMHIEQVLRGAYTSTPVDALVVCAGLGARFLGGVEDASVLPIRGQTVLLRAPWVDFGATLSGSGKHAPGEELAEPPVYIIPRPSGEVIVGGVMEPDDWFPHPRPETTVAILARALAMSPKLAQRNQNLEDLRTLIIEEGCGFRPGRTGGIRIEAESRPADGKVVVYNYGHAGQGYQSSWGSAEEAVKLLDEAFASK